MSGELNQHGEILNALAREVVLGEQGVESVIFELVRPTDLNSGHFFRNRLARWWWASRPESFFTIGFPWFSVAMVGLLNHWEWNIPIAVFSLFGALLFQISVHAFNDVEDHLRLIDRPGSLGGSGVIQKGWLSARQMRRFGYVTLFLGGIFGLPAVLSCPQILLGVGVSSVFAVLSFSNRPLGVKYSPLGDLAVFTFLGPVLNVGFSLSIFSKWDLGIVYQGFFFGFLTWSVYFAKHLQNFESERQLTKSFAAWLGFRKSRHFFVTIYVGTLFSIIFGMLSQFIPLYAGLAPFLGVPWVVLLLRRVYQASGPVSALLIPLPLKAAQCQICLGVLYSAGLVLALFLK